MLNVTAQTCLASFDKLDDPRETSTLTCLYHRLVVMVQKPLVFDETITRVVP